MAKYVCDFGTVKSMGEKLCSISSDISTSVNSYSTTIEKDLSSWSGNAKQSFESANSSLVSVSKIDCEYINELGEFITTVSKCIEDLDNQLASMTI